MLIPSELSAVIIDDNEHGRVLSEQVLKQIGLVTIYSAADVISGLGIINKNRIDFILLDWYMPEINGAGFAQLVRKGLTSCDKDLPIIVTTAYATRQNTSRMRELGLRETLAKPFSVKQLGAALTIAMANLTKENLEQDETELDTALEEAKTQTLEEDGSDQYVL